ncbi:hypothetical protein [uncultured Actinobacillus sp.]|uniref:hypothetical protein n=1 Tax=uncultured Actinobacillus sp. TaxID=417616 RepID=UPI0025F0C1AD|nr:hypothetical protein [uncultured Actinobacillus sp.]
MKKIIFASIVSLTIVGCGISTSEMRALGSKTYPIHGNAQELKQCLLDKLNDFRPDRMLINELGERTEIFIGATQAGKFRNFYLFDISRKEIKLSHYDGVFPALSERDADSYIKSCQ